jgi:O-antigen ligase
MHDDTAVDREGSRLGAWSGALFLGALGLVLWAPIPFGSVEPWALGILRVAAFCLAAVWAIACAARGRLVVERSPLQLVLYAAAAFALLQSLGATPISADPAASRDAALTLLAFGLFFSVALVALDRRSRLALAANAVFWLGFLLAVVAILQALSGATSIYWMRETSVDFYGGFANKNHFAGLMELFLPAGLGLLAAGAIPRERRVLVLFAAAIICLSIVLSRSRGGVLSLFGELAFLALAAFATRPRRHGAGGRAAAASLAGALALGACVVAGLFWIGREAVARSVADLPETISSTSAISRGVIWRDTLALVADHPLLGTGIGAYATAFGAYTRSGGTIAVHQAHNDYLQVVADAGAVGAVLAILFAVGLGLYGISSIRRQDTILRGVALGATSGCVGLLIHSFVDFNLQIPSNALAFLFTSALVVRAASTGDRAEMRAIARS